MRYLIILFILLIFSFSSFSQGLTKKDFKLYIDTIANSDQTNLITKAELFKLKKITTNFPWAQIRKITIYFYATGDEMTHCTIAKSCNGNIICKELIPYFKKCEKGSGITFCAEVYNKGGTKIDWSDLTILVTE